MYEWNGEPDGLIWDTEPEVSANHETGQSHIHTTNPALGEAKPTGFPK